MGKLEGQAMFALPSAIDLDGRGLRVVATLGEVPMLNPRFLLRMDTGTPSRYASTTFGWPTILILGRSSSHLYPHSSQETLHKEYNALHSC